MYQVGELYAELKLGIDKFTKNLEQAKQKTKSFTDTISRLAPAFIAMGAAATGVITKTIYDFTKYANEIDKVSKATNISVETAQKLAYAAEQEHTSLENLMPSLRYLSRRYAEAAEGSKEAREAFLALGINIDDLIARGATLDEVLYAIADRAMIMGESADFAGKAQAVLGRNALEIIPFLRLGSNEIRRLGDEAVRLGKVVDEKSIAAAKEFQDTLFALKTALFGAFVPIAQALIPALTNLANRLKNALVWVREKASGVLKWGLILTSAVGIVGTLTIALVKLAQVIRAVSAIIQLAKSSTLGWVGVIAGAVAAIATFTGSTYLLNNALKGFNQTQQKTTPAVEQFKEKLAKAVESPTQLKKVLGELNEKIKELEKRGGHWIQVANTLKELYAKYNEILKQHIEAQKLAQQAEEKTKEVKEDKIETEEKEYQTATDIINALRQKIEAVEELNIVYSAMNQLGIKREELENLEIDRAKQLINLIDELKRSRKEDTDAQQVYEGMTRRVTDTIVDSLFDIAFASDRMRVSFSEAMKQMLIDMFKAIVKALILKAIFTALKIPTGPTGFLMGFETPSTDIAAMMAATRRTIEGFTGIDWRRWARDFGRYTAMGYEARGGIKVIAPAPKVEVLIESPPGAYVKYIRKVPASNIKIAEEEVFERISKKRAKFL
jgi:methyl-accepting chemotaxis protein